MYDTLKCDYQLHENKSLYNGPTIPSYVIKDGFQTKDLDCVLKEYVISTHGHLLEEREGYRNITSFNGVIQFYTSLIHKNQSEWWAFDASFRNGYLLSINLKEAPKMHFRDDWSDFANIPITSEEAMYNSEFESDEGLVELPIDLDDDVILKLALQAHERNITLNQHINDILKEYL